MSTQAQWIRPDTRPEIIDQLVEGVDRYNPSNVGILEDYLYHQTRENEYDCLANIAILKLYQFNHDLYNADVVIYILLKALTVTPLPDFNLCVALLGQRNNPLLPDGEPDPLIQLLPQLNHLSNLLSTCRFPAFWTAFRSDELAPLRDNFTVECIGFEDAIRDVAIRAVKAAFINIGQKRLESYLDLSGADLDRFVTSLRWKLNSTSGVVAIPPNPDNQIAATVVQESIELPQLSKIIAHAQVV